jgi:3-oxocholest-4-en-26-oate---CoA ligase
VTTQFNLATVHETVAAAVPERECIVWGDRRLTYRDVTDRSRRLATYLHRAGLGVRTDRSRLNGWESGQDHLALYLYNGNEYIEGMLGAYKARVAPFNVNYRYVAEELRYLFDDGSPRAVIYHAAFAPLLAQVLPTLSDVAVLLQVADDSGEALLPGAVDYEDALAEAEPELPPVEPSPDDLYLLYTGGTTGMPKGVVWRQHDIFMAAMGGRQIGTWIESGSYEEIADAARATAGMRMMPTPPFMHGASQWAAFICMTGGGTLVIQGNTRRLDPVDVWRIVERERVQSVTVVGDALARPLIEELERGHYDISSLAVLGNGGAPLNPALKQRLLDSCPNLFVSDSMGSSETGAQATHLSTKDGVRTGNFSPGPGAVVVDEAMTRLLEPGDDAIGWLAQQGHVPLGYLHDEAKTKRTFPVIDGVRYAVPGDRAIWLADGSIELLGRDAVTINSGGEKIFAEEVEKAIGAHPGVRDVVCVGRPSERWGQEVVALVAVSGEGVTEVELTETASRFIARYKLPKAWIFLSEIRRSPAGKADYRWAAQTAREAVG